MVADSSEAGGHSSGQPGKVGGQQIHTRRVQVEGDCEAEANQVEDQERKLYKGLP